MHLLTGKKLKTELRLAFRFELDEKFMFLLFGVPVFDLLVVDKDCLSRKPAVIMIVGVNGGGKTTSLGKIYYVVMESLKHSVSSKMLY